MPVPEPLRPADARVRPVERFAARTAGMTASEIRALFAVASRPEVVSLAGGMPNLAALPLDALGGRGGRPRRARRPGRAAVRLGAGRSRAARADLRGHGAGGDRGRPGRRRGHGRLADGARPRHPDLLRPRRRRARRGTVLRGRARVLRGLPGAGRARRDGRARPGAGAAPRGVPHARRHAASSQVPLHDPELPQPGRRDADRAAAARGARHLRASTACSCSRTTPTACSGSPARSTRRCASMDPDVIYLGSFSKTFASGLRVGWALVPPAVRDRLVLAAESATLCPPTFNQLLVSRYLADPRLARADEGVHRGLPRAPGRDDRRAGDLPAARFHVEHPGRRLLRVADRAGGRRHEGDAAAGRHGARGVRVGHRLLRGRLRQQPTASVVLLPDAGAHHRGRAQAGRRARGRAGRHPHVRQRGAAPPAVRGRRHPRRTPPDPSASIATGHNAL